MLTDPSGGVGISFGQTIPHGWFTSIFGQIVFAIDGNAGGSYAPSAPIIIGGSGISITGVAGFSGAVTGFTGAEVVFAGALVVFGAFTPVTFAGTVALNGAVTFGSTGTFVGLVTTNALTANGAVQALSTFGAAGAATFLSTATFVGTTTFAAPATHSDEIILSGTGRIRERVIYAPDADHTFAPTDGTVLVAQSSITATHIWTLNDAAVEGAKLKLINYSTHAITLHNQGGGSLLTAGSLPAFSSPLPGVVNLVWLNNGTYIGWSGA